MCQHCWIKEVQTRGCGGCDCGCGCGLVVVAAATVGGDWTITICHVVCAVWRLPELLQLK